MSELLLLWVAGRSNSQDTTKASARHVFALYPVKKTRDKHVSGMYLHRVVFDMNGTQHTRVLDVSGYI
jgi:hypothetical protein